MKYNNVSIIFLILIVIGQFVVSCSGGDDKSAEMLDLRKQLAGELRDSRLYEAAIEEYKKILASSDIDIKTRANINYLIARVYFEDLQDYEDAAAYYVRARSLDPKGSFTGEASKKLVASLEKMGRVLDAKRQLDVTTDIDYTPPESGDVMVARIDNEPVWLSRVDEQIQNLPAELQKELINRKAKVKYVQNYVGIELIHRAAIRENYDDDPEIKKQFQDLMKNLLVEKYMTEKVVPEIDIDTLDVRNFYKANREDRYNSAPFDSVRTRVYLDYQTEKAETAFSEYINKLAKAEKVEFFEENIK